MKTDSSSSGETSKSEGGERIAAQTFSFHELATATKNFRAECQLGEGGFGRVYKGRLESTNQVSCKIKILKRSYQSLYKLNAGLLSHEGGKQATENLVFMLGIGCCYKAT